MNPKKLSDNPEIESFTRRLTLGAEGGGANLSVRVDAILRGGRAGRLSRRALLATAIGGASSLTALAALRPQTPSPASESRTFSGIVATPDGKPAPGATVFLIADDFEEPFVEPVVAETKTDSAGKFALTAPGNLKRLVFVALADGFGMAIGPRGLLPAMAKSPISLTLGEAATLSVTCRTPDGKPAANLLVGPATLTLNETQTRFFFVRFPATLLARLGARTDSAGLATLKNLPRGATVRLDTDSPEFAAFDGFVPLTGRANAFAVTATPAGAVSGRVVDSVTGKPVPGIWVSAQAQSTGSGGGNARTDADGRYAMRRLKSERYNIALDIRAPLSENRTARALEGVFVGPGANLSGKNFELIRGGEITGIVKGADGKPLPNISIGLYGPAHPESSAWVQSAKTDARGRFVLRTPAGKQMVYVMQAVDGHDNPGQSIQKFDLSENAARNVVFTLPKLDTPPPLVGIIVDDSGRPVEGAQVEIVVAGDPKWDAAEAARSEIDFRPPVTTAADGSFSWKLRKVSGPFAARARKGNWQTERPVPLTPGVPVTIALRKTEPRQLVARIVDELGAPLEGVSVSLMETSANMSQAIAQRTTDKNGLAEFATENLFQSGEFYLSAVKAGYLPAPGNANERQFSSLSLNGPKTLVMNAATGFVEGKVVDGKGAPMPGIRVFADNVEGVLPETTTDSAGRFRLTNLPSRGEIMVSISRSGQSGVRKTVPSGTKNLVLVLP